MKLTRREQILSGIREQNEKAEYRGASGYWVQSDCVFIEADHPQEAIAKYRKRVSDAKIGISHNYFCDGISRAKLLEG